MKACASGRLRGPGPNAPSIGVTGRNSPESFQLISESGMEPGAAGPVHRAGEDHQHPCEPLGDVGALGRHGDAGAGFDRHTLGGAHRLAQPNQVGLGDVGELRAVFKCERLHRGGQRVDALHRHIGFHSVAQDFANQVGQHGVVGAGTRRQVGGGQPRGLGAARVDHPHLPAPGDFAHRAGRVGHGYRMAMRHNGIDTDEQ